MVFLDQSETSAASLAAERHLPSRRLACSTDLDWRSVLARAYLDPDETEAFTTAPTPDLLVVVAVSGTSSMEVRRPRGWARAVYRPGAIGVTAPGNSSTLRWRALGPASRRSLHVHLHAGLLRHTAEELGRPSLLERLPDTLLLDDPYVTAGAQALWTALQQRADPLYADSVAAALAAHLVYGRLLGGRTSQAHAALAGPAVQRVVAYMQDHLAERIVLDDLAEVAKVSKYHFLRVFTGATGVTPHRYLVRLRMQRAAELLRTSEYTIAQVAALCGYASPGQFTSTFRRVHGAAPAQYRRTVRG